MGYAFYPQCSQSVMASPKNLYEPKLIQVKLRSRNQGRCIFVIDAVSCRKESSQDAYWTS